MKYYSKLQSAGFYIADMNNGYQNIYYLLRLLFGSIWAINGLYCKVSGMVPRHGLIVGRILGDSHAQTLTIAIGFWEICMGIWVWSGIRSRLCAVLQIAAIASMNCIEFLLADDLLLFGTFNALLALLLVFIIYWNEFFNPGKLEINKTI